VYFWREWDALKSVKYIPAAHINHDRAFCSRASASPSYTFHFCINDLPMLTSRQGAFSYNPAQGNADANVSTSGGSSEMPPFATSIQKASWPVSRVLCRRPHRHPRKVKPCPGSLTLKRLRFCGPGSCFAWPGRGSVGQIGGVCLAVSRKQEIRQVQRRQESDQVA